MKLNELSPALGSKTEGKRKGRGAGSGNGKTAGRGHKGQNARSGGGVRPGFEGGQMPIYRRLPKRGFTNIFAKQYAEVKLSDLNKFEDGAEITPEILKNVLTTSIENKLEGGKITTDEIGLNISSTKMVLPCGIYGRYISND